MAGAQFWRVRPSKIRFGEWLRTATAATNEKNSFRRRLQTHFFGSGPVFCPFSVHFGPQDRKDGGLFLVTFLLFFVFFFGFDFCCDFGWFFSPKATKNVEKTMKKQAFPPTSSPVPTTSLPMTSSSFSQWMVSSRDLSQWMGGRCFRLCRLN